MSDDRILKTMQLMEWCRIKGMLQGMLHTYWDDGRNPLRQQEDIENGSDPFTNSLKIIEKFIEDMKEIIE